MSSSKPDFVLPVLLGVTMLATGLSDHFGRADAASAIREGKSFIPDLRGVHAPPGAVVPKSVDEDGAMPEAGEGPEHSIA